ncbi:MAG TPA: universal stress protein [Baekduia sp.]|nr:universal stress protein [Baekduia sp.]
MFTSIVVGTDGSESADKALDEAIAIAQANGATLHVVTAFEPETLRRMERENEAEAIAAGMDWAYNARDEITARVTHAEELAKNAGVNVTPHTREGSAAKVLIDIATELNADLIVVGNKGMSGLKHFVLSVVPDKVSHNAPCSVLIVQTT